MDRSLLSHPQEEVFVTLNQEKTVVIPNRRFDDTAEHARALGPGHVAAFREQVKRQMDALSPSILPPPTP